MHAVGGLPAAQLKPTQALPCCARYIGGWNNDKITILTEEGLENGLHRDVNNLTRYLLECIMHATNETSYVA